MTLAQAQDQLKVITFNIKSFENSNFDVKPFAKLLAEENADIICLNEVENRSARQMDPKTLKYRDVVQDLAANLKLFGVFGYSYNLMNKKGDEDESKYTFCQDELYGNAILSRYPILNINAMQLPRPANSADQRGAVTAEILLPSGKMVRVACTHLDHIGGQMEQAKVLVGGNVRRHEPVAGNGSNQTARRLIRPSLPGRKDLSGRIETRLYLWFEKCFRGSRKAYQQQCLRRRDTVRPFPCNFCH